MPLIGIPAVVLAAAFDPAGAQSAASQDWPPFVLVSGLLLIGRAAGEEGLFSAAGRLLARSGRRPLALVLAAAALVSVVTALLNLDTSVVFVTPIVLAAARRRGAAIEPVLYLSVFLANAASLLLPGSNLTNLIVLGSYGPRGAAFADHMVVPWVCAIVATTATLAVLLRRWLRPAAAPDVVDEPTAAAPLRPGAGTTGVVLAVIAMLALPAPVMAVVVLALGVLCTVLQAPSAHEALQRAASTVDVRVLTGLLALAIALGVAGRAWGDLSYLLSHLDSWATGGLAALAAVAVNNLPAASLLGAHRPPDPYALLIGLNLGPNLAITGSLSAVLWLEVSRASGAAPSVRRYSLLGLVVVPISMAAALGAFALVH